MNGFWRCSYELYKRYTADHTQTRDNLEHTVVCLNMERDMKQFIENTVFMLIGALFGAIIGGAGIMNYINKNSLCSGRACVFYYDSSNPVDLRKF